MVCEQLSRPIVATLNFVSVTLFTLPYFPAFTIPYMYVFRESSAIEK